ncbi:MAG TPA: asparagine synthase-related protein [Candidatus Nanoarchaeia archaeon]|nr:asparagine synthase-related protein [Candidatus Nanoarchaeia archaeon]
MATYLNVFQASSLVMLLAAAVKNGKLVSEQQWQRHIASLRKKTVKAGTYSSRAAARKDIHSKLVAAVKKRAHGQGKFGVLLSGGVDSSFIALVLKKLGYRFQCFSVGIAGSRDLAAAKLAAKALGLRLISKEYDMASAGEVIMEAVKLLRTADPVTIGIAATEVAALRLASANKIRVVFTGLGSEEIFAGYQRHVTAKDINRECWHGLSGMWKRDFLRDFAVAARFKATALTPFLDQQVIVAAMRAKPEWKIHHGEKKLILREIAAAAGLPVSIAFRPKMAAQYGSGFDKALEKLGKKSGFGNKRDYLASLLG